MQGLPLSWQGVPLSAKGHSVSSQGLWKEASCHYPATRAAQASALPVPTSPVLLDK
jgi:hypothetical protein